MSAAWTWASGWGRGVAEAWNGFWFVPAQPHTLALIRMLTGAMLFYTHLVWSLDLMAFLGPDSWVPAETARLLQHEFFQRQYAWSYLWHVQSPALLWVLHGLSLVVFALLTVGLFSRVMAVLAWLITVSYCHRLTGSLFGLDQVNAMLAMYLMVGPCGAVWSLDRLWARWWRVATEAPRPAISTNIALRLMQLHLCVIYLFGGIGKMRGELWWDGSALWYAVANLEYQSLDLTWLIHAKWLIALLTHVTVFWETFYCVLIWPRLTRPVMLTLAVLVHGGIAVGLGMITFGTAMLIANLAFVSPATIERLPRDVIQRVTGRRMPRGRAGGARRAKPTRPPAPPTRAMP